MYLETNRALTRMAFYKGILAIGRGAEVFVAHPHYDRDSVATRLLSRGPSPYDVAKLLSDTVDTIEKFYVPFYSRAPRTGKAHYRKG